MFRVVMAPSVWGRLVTGRQEVGGRQQARDHRSEEVVSHALYLPQFVAPDITGCISGLIAHLKIDCHIELAVDSIW